jgi:hypothetical protein
MKDLRLDAWGLLICDWDVHPDEIQVERVRSGKLVVCNYYRHTYETIGCGMITHR